MKLAAKWTTRPNGIAISPNGRTLYVSAPDDRAIRAYDLDKEGDASNERVFASKIDGIPGGMRVDEKGNLYVAANGIQVFHPDGKLVHTIPVRERPSNCAFGGPDGKTLFITARGQLYRAKVDVKGESIDSQDDRRYPKRPLMGVGALIFDQERILMAQRGKQPLQGWWSLPGGALETGEFCMTPSAAKCGKRPGSKFEPLGVIEIFERIMRDAEGIAGISLRADRLHLPDHWGDACGWRRRMRGCMGAPNRDLPSLRITEGTLAVIEKAFRDRRQYR